MFARITFIVFLFFIPVSVSYCHGSKTSYRAQFMGELVQDNKVLLGHVFATFPVQNFSQCFALCKDDCRCRSFNLPMTGQGNCELNSADNSTVLMKPLRGWRYHHLQMKEVLQGDDTCYEPYENGCCGKNPCHTGSVCSETGDRGKPGVDCNCTTEGYTGQLCERKIHSCFDYLWHDKNAASGYYDIWDKNDVKFHVFCDMQPEKMEAWTLVMSYDQSEKNVFKNKPFFIDFASNQLDAASGSYRLSLTAMESILEAMGTERDVEWKATCNYNFADKMSPNSEMVRSSFSTLDIMNFKTNEKSLVGLFPFSDKTAGQDKSGFGNSASLYSTSYEDGPLGTESGSVRMTGSTSSYIRLYDSSGKLDTAYSLTIMMQIYPYTYVEAPLFGWADSSNWGVHLWQLKGDIYFCANWRSDTDMSSKIQVAGLGINMWNYVAVTYDYQNLHQAVYVNGTLLQKVSISQNQIKTNQYPMTMGYKYGDDRVYNGRVACLRMFSEALTDQEIKKLTTDWTCPPEPEPICHRVDYINIRGKECYNCNVWATQTNAEAFTINAHRGDQANGCNFKSGSTVLNENIFGVYDAVDAANHACAASADASTQYWFGGKL